MMLITGCILVFSVTGTTPLTPSLEQAVSVLVPEHCSLETAVVYAQKSGSGCTCG